MSPDSIPIIRRWLFLLSALIFALALVLYYFPDYQTDIGNSQGWYVTCQTINRGVYLYPRHVILDPRGPGGIFTRQMTAVFIPSASLLVAAMLVFSLAWVMWTENRPGICQQCGYDLRATPERCPECGWEPASQP